MTDVPMSSTSTARQLPINLFTRSTSHAIPQSTYFIPSDWRRFQLSELINKVLGNGNEGGAPVPFDFVVEGEVLRGSLENWVKRNRGADEESTINVEYIQSLLPPQHVSSFPQEDWVSGLSLSRPGTILVSSYLSHLRVLPNSSSTASTITLPLPLSLGATCCRWISPNETTSDILLAAGGVDRQTHVFSLGSLDDPASGKELYTLHGHTGPISSVISSASGREIITSSWDSTINLYVLPDAEPTEHQLPAEPLSYLPGQGNKKKRKIESEKEKLPIEGLTDGDATGTGGWRRTPELTMKGHKARVGGLVWDKQNKETIWSGGWDGSVRGWDWESGSGVVVRQGPMDKSILCIDQFSSSAVLATGSMDRTISLWDTRDATSLISQTLATGSPIGSLKCHPTSAFTLASTTYSGLVQIWDIRSPKNPLFSVSKANDIREKVTKNGKVLGERLLAGDWDGELLVAGGEDGDVGVWRGRGE
ncbi:ribosome biogenesis protein, partial [Tremellales sp. Uapishka_1]